MRVLTFFGITFAFLFHAVSLNAQQFDWHALEKNILEKKTLNQSKHQLDSLLQQPVRVQRYPEIARAIENRLQIDDQRSEDSLFFFNSCILDSMLERYPQEPGLSNLLYLIRYRRITQYLNKSNHFRKGSLLKRGCSPVVYAEKNTEQLRQMARQDLLYSLRFTRPLPEYPLQQLLWISTNMARVLFKPAFKDLLYSEAVQEFSNIHSNTPSMVLDSMIRLTPDRLLSQCFEDTRLNHDLEDFYNTVSEWQHEYPVESEQWHCIDLLARRFFYVSDAAPLQSWNSYSSLLYQQLSSAYASVRSTALYELAVQLKNQGQQYYKEDYWSGSGYQNRFDSSYRWKYLELLQLMDRYSGSADSFPVVRKKLMMMRDEVLQKKLSMRFSDVVPPDRAFSIDIRAANIDTLQLNIYRLPAVAIISGTQQIQLEQLRQYPVIRRDTMILPANQDFQKHAFQISLKGLQAGVYALLPESQDLEKPLQVSVFQVSAISVINDEAHTFVVDRNSGFPLKDAAVQPWKDTSRHSMLIPLKKRNLDHNGMLILSDDRIRKITVMRGTDTLTTSYSFHDSKPADALFDPTSGDDLVDYFSENCSVHFYLDRSIYRPGQEVHFKAIVLTRNPLTGKQMVLNHENVRVPGMRKWRLTKEDLKDLIPDSVKVYINDPFTKYTDTLSLSLNRFGSLSGTFKLPEEAATGSWEIGIDDHDLDWDEVRDKSFRVEEYKRPNYQLQIEDLPKNLKAGDSFSIKVRCLSFTDQPLEGVQIKASLNLQFSSLGKRTDGAPLTEQRGESINLIEDSSCTTQRDGEVRIPVPVKFLSQYYLDSMHAYTFRYQLDVESVDASGESHEKNQSFTLYSMPYEIQVTANPVQERASLKPVYYQVKYRKGSLVDLPVQASIYQQIPQAASSREPVTDYVLKDGKWVYQPPVYRKQPDVSEVLVYQTQLKAGNRQWSIDSLHLKAGTYYLQMQVIESGQLKASKRVSFSLFDQEAGTYPGEKELFEFATVRDALPGDTLQVYFGQPNNNVYTITQFKAALLTRKGSRVINSYQYASIGKGIQQQRFPVPANATGRVTITRLFVLNNEVYQQELNVNLLPQTEHEPKIVLNHFKSVTAPGAHETWKLSVTTESPDAAAEVMTTLYDAKLDQLEPHNWELPSRQVYWNLKPYWTRQITEFIQSGFYFKSNTSIGKKEAPLWWLNPLDELDLFQDGDGIGDQISMRKDLTGSLMGVSGSRLDEVVVVGYGTVQRKMITTSSVTIRVRGISSLSEYSKRLVIVDGVVYSGDLKGIDPNLIQEGLLLDGAEATALFGSRAAEGVLILSTKGPIRLEDLLPPVPPPPPFKPRKNFAELAYFSPALSIDESGNYVMEFTLPESVTSWNWKLFAHTLDGRFNQLSQKIISRLPLMLEPRLPRHLYQGDELQLPVRIMQTGAEPIHAEVSIQATDVVTGAPISEQLLKHTSQKIEVPANGSGTLYFNLKVPDQFLHPIRITARASADGYTDGEEHELPVLSRRILMTQTTSIHLKPGTDTIITIPAIPKDAQMTGSALLIQAKPYAALINALPYLTGYKYSCAEQTFNKLYAFWLARKLVREDSLLQTALKNQPEPNPVALTETAPEPAAAHMPWLQLARQMKLQQQELRHVFDTLEGWKRTRDLLAQLYRLQLPDGGLTWFPGGRSQPDMSLYILDGIYRLRADSGTLVQDTSAAVQWNQFTEALERYVDRWFLNHHTGNNWLEEQYTLIRTGNGQIPSPELRTVTDSVMNQLWKRAHQFNLNKQARLILASFKSLSNSEQLHQKASALLESIRQQAISDPSAGLRWKEISDGDDLSTHSEEILALLGEAFWLDGRTSDCKEIVRWLLGNREYHHWGSTRSTAAIVRLLSRTAKLAVSSVNQFISNPGFSVNDGLLDGQFMNYQTETKPDLQRKISCRSTIAGSDEPVAGSWQQYYLTGIVSEDSLGPLRIQKKIRVRSEQGAHAAWRELQENEQLQPGDRIQTQLILFSRTALQYVYINDPRHGTLEPVEAESGYRYGSELAYYESVRDEATEIFAEQIPAGTTHIVYESKVTLSGSFGCAPVVLQCLYRPDLKAYAPSAPIRVAASR